ncbi:MAG: sugar transferase [Phycisphaerae bacterium]|nr:sugar transferase [Phycisphaerae bacterium]
MLKRLIDILITLPALIILIPLAFIPIIIWIRLSSKGPAIFRQERAGKDAKPFILLKFRTMRTDADPYGNSPKDGSDPRLTKVGKILRETSLDELPQLINVFFGQMTLVGPRPLYISQIPEWNDYQKRRLEVKPGLTGLAQVSGRGQLTIEKKLNLDVQYVDNASIWYDLKLIFITFLQLLGRKDIYEDKYSETQDTRDGSD